MFDSKPRLLQEAVFDGTEFVLRFPYNPKLKPFLSELGLRYIGAKDHPYYRSFRGTEGAASALAELVPKILQATEFAYNESPVTFTAKLMAAKEKPNQKALLKGVQITLYTVTEEKIPVTKSKSADKKKQDQPAPEPKGRLAELLLEANEEALPRAELKSATTVTRVAAAFPFHAGLNTVCSKMGGQYMPAIRGWIIDKTTPAAFQMQVERDLGVPSEQFTIMDGLFDVQTAHDNGTFADAGNLLGACLKPASKDAVDQATQKNADLQKAGSLLPRIPIRKAGPVSKSDLEAALQEFKLDEYQNEGVRHLLRYSSSLLADDMGLGKTRQAIVAAEIARRGGQVLVVVPASVALNWRNEIRMVRPKARVSIIDYDPQAEWVITTYGQVLKLRDLARRFRVMICDEAHLLKSPVSKRTHDTFAVAQHIDTRMVLTGTPVMNTEAEIHTLLRISGHPFGDLDLVTFRDEFGGGSASRLKLNKALNDWLLRRDKSTVLTLPGKTRPPCWHVLQPEHQAAYSAAIADSSMTALQKLGKLRYLLERGKLDVALRLAKALPRTEKLIVFCEYVPIVEELMRLLSQVRIGAVQYTGSMSKTARQAAVDQFQRDETTKVFVGTSGAAGVGITLVAANHVLFLGRPWTFAIQEQAEDRAYRRGQLKPVFVHIPVVPDTIDGFITALIKGKGDLSEEVVKGKIITHLQSQAAQAETTLYAAG